MTEEYDMKSPELEFKRADGSTIRFYRHKTEPYRFKAEVDGKAYDPNEMIDKVKGKYNTGK